MSLFSKLHGAVTRMSFGAEATLAEGTVFAKIKDTLMDGTEVTMEDFKGDVCVVVNVASK